MADSFDCFGLGFPLLAAVGRWWALLGAVGRWWAGNLSFGNQFTVSVGAKVMIPPNLGKNLQVCNTVHVN